MADDYNPDEFAVRVSPGLFEVLAGRATAAAPVEPRTARESALIESVRKDEARKRTVMLRSLKETSAKEAVEKTHAAKQALDRETAALESKLQQMTANLKASPEDLPCARLRKETLECFRGEGSGHPMACSSQVEAFTACARNVSKLER